MKRATLMFSFLFIGISSMTSMGQNTDWTGATDSDFTNAGNWSDGVPDDFDTVARIDGGANLPVTIGDVGDWDVGAIVIGDLEGGSLVQNGGVLVVNGDDTGAESAVGIDAADPTSWVLNNNATVLYDDPLVEDGFDTDGTGKDFDVGKNTTEDAFGTLEMHGDSVFRISDDLKVGDGSSGHGMVVMDGNSLMTVGSGISASGTSIFELSGNAVLVTGNSSNPGDSELGRTNEGYLTLSTGGGEEATVTVTENAKIYARTLQQRGGISSIELRDNGEFHVFDVFNFAGPDLGVATITGEAAGPQRTTHVSQNGDAETIISLFDSSVMSIDSELDDSLYRGIALSGGNNRGQNSGDGGMTIIEVRDSASFAVEQDLNMTYGVGELAESTLSVRGPDASVAINGDLRMAIDDVENENPGTATLEAVITGGAHATVAVGGEAFIGNGSLAVVFDGYSPIGGESYELLTAGAIDAGAFRETSLPGLPEGLEWDLAIGATSIILNVLGGGCDINGDGTCDAADIDAMSQLVKDGQATPEQRTALIESPMPAGFNTYIGDSDLNGVFDEQDIVEGFIAGKYLTGSPAGWAEGDWDGDLLFDERDFVAAFIAGAYLSPPRPSAAAVPEPSSLVLLAIGLLALARRK